MLKKRTRLLITKKNLNRRRGWRHLRQQLPSSHRTLTWISRLSQVIHLTVIFLVYWLRKAWKVIKIIMFATRRHRLKRVRWTWFLWLTKSKYLKQRGRRPLCSSSTSQSLSPFSTLQWERQLHKLEASLPAKAVIVRSHSQCPQIKSLHISNQDRHSELIRGHC